MEKSKLGRGVLIAMLLAVVGIGAAGGFFLYAPKIAYVDTARLMVGFSDAAKVEKELKAEDAKWREQLKVLEDSTQAAVDRMSAEFDKASPNRKRELQDMLAARNQQINNFRHANNERMRKLRDEKLKSVLEKANVYLSEYGEKHGYSIIFGTASAGSIVYGDKERFDITDEVVTGLNERYK
jgi:outer membrane protein